jgi:hypothetical protein
MTTWTAPKELPDLGHVGEIAIDNETEERGALIAIIWPWG